MNIPSKLSFEVDFSSPLISLPGLNLFVSSFLSYFLFEIWDFFLKIDLNAISGNLNCGGQKS
jgi:hypothetical protein